MRHLTWSLPLVLALSQSVPVEAKSSRTLAAEVVKTCAVADLTTIALKQALNTQLKELSWSKSKINEVMSAAAESAKKRRAGYDAGVTKYLSESYTADELQIDLQVCKITYFRQWFTAQLLGKPKPDDAKLKASDREFLGAHMMATFGHVFSPENNTLMAPFMENVEKDLKDLLNVEQQ